MPDTTQRRAPCWESRMMMTRIWLPVPRPDDSLPNNLQPVVLYRSQQQQPQQRRRPPALDAQTGAAVARTKTELRHVSRHFRDAWWPLWWLLCCWCLLCGSNSRAGILVEAQSINDLSSSDHRRRSTADNNSNNAVSFRRLSSSSSPWLRLACQPCIDRPSTHVRFLGLRDDDATPQQLQQAVAQTASNLRVTLHVDLLETPAALVGELVALADRAQTALLQQQQQQKQPSASRRRPPSSRLLPDAVIVAVPPQQEQEQVHNAVRELISTTGMPVVGLNARYPSLLQNDNHHKNDDPDDSVGWLAWVGTDEYRAGVLAGRELQRRAVKEHRRPPIQRVLHVLVVDPEDNSGVDNDAIWPKFQRQRQGLEDGLAARMGPSFENDTNTTTTVTTPPSNTITNSTIQSPFSASTQATTTNNVKAATPSAGIFRPFPMPPNNNITSSSSSNNNNISNVTVQVDQVVLEGPTDPSAVLKLFAALLDCPYQAVMTSSAVVDMTLQVVAASCHSTTSTTMTTTSSRSSSSSGPLVGSFDANLHIYQLLANNNERDPSVLAAAAAIVEEAPPHPLEFALARQEWLQGALATALATVYASTGMQPPPLQSTPHYHQHSHANEKDAQDAKNNANDELYRIHSLYLSGPRLVTADNLPSHELQFCETEGFPLCEDQDDDSNNNNNQPFTMTAAAREGTPPVLQELGRSSLGCPCFHQPSVRLAAVTHGRNDEPFWTRVRDAALQAADDMNVQLDFPLRGDTPDIFHVQIGSRIVALCEQGVDGLVVSIPTDGLDVALRRCRELDVPIVSINSGAALSQELGLLHHVAQYEYSAGYLAATEFMQAGARRGICLNHDSTIDVLRERCHGFGDAFVESLGEQAYVGMVEVSPGNTAITIARVERAMAAVTGGWDGLAILVLTSSMLPALSFLTKNYSGVLGGTFDNDAKVQAALRQGTILFGIDQQPYLQGYLPILLLVWYVQTGQSLNNHFIWSGPTLVDSSPSVAEEQCQGTNYAICPAPLREEFNQLGAVRFVGYGLTAIVLFTSLSFATWVAAYRHDRLSIQQSQPFLLFMVCLGAALMGCTIVFLGIDDEHYSEAQCDAACIAAPWFFAMGFTIVFAALYSKLWRINKLVTNSLPFCLVEVKMKDVMLPFCILLSLNVALLTTWTVKDPMYWKRTNDRAESYGLCRVGDTTISVVIALSILGVNVFALFLALWQAYNLHQLGFEFTHGSGSIVYVVVSICKLTIVGVPILPLVRDNPLASFLLKAGLVFVMSMSSLLFIFVPKIRNKQDKEDESLPEADDPSEQFFRGAIAAYLERTRQQSMRSVDFADYDVDEAIAKDHLRASASSLRASREKGGIAARKALERTMPDEIAEPLDVKSRVDLDNRDDEKQERAAMVRETGGFELGAERAGFLQTSLSPRARKPTTADSWLDVGTGPLFASGDMKTPPRTNKPTVTRNQRDDSWLDVGTGPLFASGDMKTPPRTNKPTVTRNKRDDSWLDVGTGPLFASGDITLPSQRSRKSTSTSSKKRDDSWLDVGTGSLFASGDITMVSIAEDPHDPKLGGSASSLSFGKRKGRRALPKTGSDSDVIGVRRCRIDPFGHELELTEEGEEEYESMEEIPEIPSTTPVSEKEPRVLHNTASDGYISGAGVGKEERNEEDATSSPIQAEDDSGPWMERDEENLREALTRRLIGAAGSVESNELNNMYRVPDYEDLTERSEDVCAFVPSINEPTASSPPKVIRCLKLDVLPANADPPLLDGHYSSLQGQEIHQQGSPALSTPSSPPSLPVAPSSSLSTEEMEFTPNNSLPSPPRRTAEGDAAAGGDAMVPPPSTTTTTMPQLTPSTLARQHLPIPSTPSATESEEEFHNEHNSPAKRLLLANTTIPLDGVASHHSEDDDDDDDDHVQDSILRAASSSGTPPRRRSTAMSHGSDLQSLAQQLAELIHTSTIDDAELFQTFGQYGIPHAGSTSSLRFTGPEGGGTTATSTTAGTSPTSLSLNDKEDDSMLHNDKNNKDNSAADARNRDSQLGEEEEWIAP